MPPPTLLVLKNKSTPIQVWKLLNGTTLDAAQDGNDFVTGAATEGIIAGTETSANSVIEAFGKRFVWHRYAIHERDVSGDGTWEPIFTPTNLAHAARYHTGLHLVYPNGVPTLVGLYARNANANIDVISTTDGINWSEDSFAVFNSGWSRLGRSTAFGSSVYWTLHDNGQLAMVSYNFATGSSATWNRTDLDADFLADSVQTVDFAIHKDKLFVAASHTGLASSEPLLFRLDGSSWTNLGTIHSGVNNTGGAADRPVLFSEGNDLIFFYNGDAPYCRQIQNPLTNSITVNNLANPVSGLGGTNLGSWHKYRDVTAPGSPVWYFWYNVGGQNAGSYDCYQWMGTGSSMTLVGTGIAAADFAMPNSGDGGSERIPAKTEGRPQFSTLPEEVMGGGRKRYFRVYGQGSDLTLSQYHNADQQAPDTLSTLVASSIAIEDTTDVTGLVGNLGEVALEALSPSAGDAYVVSAEDGDGTLNPGAVVIRVGDIVKYNGTIWQMVQSTTTLGSNLEAYWKLNDDGLDETTNNRDWTFTGVEGYNTGLFQNGYEVLGASGRYATQSGHDPIFDLPQLEPWAMSLWVNVDALATTQALLSKGDGTLGGGSADGWTLRIGTDGHVRFVHHQNGVNHSTSAGLITAGAGMQHIVVTNDGVTEKIYIDNIERASNPSAVSFTNQTAALYMGNIVTGTNPLDGVIDEVSFWSKALSPADVARLYNGGAGQGLGFPDFGIHVTLNSSTALISPYTDGADDGKTASFNGTSLDGTVLTAPSNTTSQITVTPDDGATEYSYTHAAGTDSLSTGDVHTVMLDIV